LKVQCTPGTSEDDLLYKYVPSEDTKSGIKLTLGPIPRALQLSRKKMVVLVLDEFDKTRPSADALLLDVLQNYRISLYIDNKKSVIYGNPRNLVIFITSNDFREFSEPLLRRLAVITLSHLPTQRVFQILSSRFNDTVARLLAQIYDDTVRAGLRKPATLQELYELGEILSFSDGAEIDLLTLVKTFVIKFDDDLARYLSFISGRDPYLFRESKPREKSIEEYYIPKKPVQIESPEEEKPEKRLSIRDLLDTLKVDTKVNPVHTAAEKTTVSFVAKDDEGEMYNAIVKTLRPEPSENPAVLGKFELWNVLEKPYITAKDPLKFSEVVELTNRDQLRFEAYVEDTVKITTAQIEKIVGSSAVKVRAYSRRLLRFEENNNNGDNTVLTELVLDRDYVPRKAELFNAKIKMYVRKKSNTIPKEVIWTIRNYIDYIADYMKRGILLDRDANVIAEVLKKSDFENERALWLLSVFKEDIELFKEICRILKVKIEKTEDKNKVIYYNWDVELRIYISRKHYNDFIALEEVVTNA
jgi:MoxR-like ATPase